MPDGVGYYTHVSYYMDFVRAATNLTTAELIDPSSSIKMAADDSSAAGFALQQTITRQCMHMYLALLVWLLVSRFLP
ncbi:hypothetical protein EV182_006337 [Spiromyces aspiralis]|uniref:Uncharacterized protein n=1 Tax=Spiromyces aspiralis TaxID=68401 RepID=A0ACC1HFZ8_9FUNG|nr:hypothetical protein EV182_006337 [Spiromyces aspiralis]